MATPARRRVRLGVEERDCRICGRVTQQELGMSMPSRRMRLLPRRVDTIDLVERRYSRCTACGYSFALED